MTTADAEQTWSVGACVLEVPVAPGTAMAGFAARTEPSVGVHDPMTVRALVVEDACWITVDVCGLDEATCLAIREAAPLPTDRVVVSATHTHSGPCSMPHRLGRADPALVTEISRAAVDACRLAVSAVSPCSVTYQAFSGLDIARNRRRPDIPIDPELQAMVFTTTDASVVAWLLQFPCHPVVLGADNRLISGDYPAYVRKHLEADAPGSVALFLTGAAGDVNTGHTAESSYSQGGSPTRTFEEAERIGRTLAAAGQATRASAPGASADRPAVPFVSSTARQLTVLTAEITLELEVLDAQHPGELASQWTKQAQGAPAGERALLRIWSEWARAHDDAPDLRWTGTVTVMRIAGILLVALPGEPFLAAAEQIQREFDIPVIVAGYSNGCPGYFPTAAEYDFGGYEVRDAHRYYGMPAPFKRGSLERLVHTAVTLGRQLT